MTSNRQITRWESKRPFFRFSPSLSSTRFQTPRSTLSIALCATAPITLIPCAMISWNIYGAGSFRRHFEPFHSHPLANERKLPFAAASSRDAAEWLGANGLSALRGLSCESDRFVSKGCTQTTTHLLKKMDHSGIWSASNKAAYWRLTWWKEGAKRSWLLLVLARCKNPHPKLVSVKISGCQEGNNRTTCRVYTSSNGRAAQKLKISERYRKERFKLTVLLGWEGNR